MVIGNKRALILYLTTGAKTYRSGTVYMYNQFETVNVYTRQINNDEIILIMTLLKSLYVFMSHII